MQQINTCLVGQKILLDSGSNRTRLHSPTLWHCNKCIKTFGFPLSFCTDQLENLYFGNKIQKLLIIHLTIFCGSKMAFAMSVLKFYIKINTLKEMEPSKIHSKTFCKVIWHFLPHLKGHLYFLKGSWMSMCRFTLSFLLNVASQRVHLYGFSPGKHNQHHFTQLE